MNTWIKTSAIVLAGALSTTAAFAQDVKKIEKTTGKHQEIIIRKSDDKKEKTTIVIDGEKITVNGKPLNELKDSDVRVIMRDKPSLSIAPRTRVLSTPRGGYQMFDDRANRALLGVTTERSDEGAKITVISKESGAEKAGLKEGDVITKVGDKKIEDGDDLVAAINGYKPKDKVDITYKRGNKENKTAAVLGENKIKAFSFNNNEDFQFNMPELSGAMGQNFLYGFRKPKIGMQIQDVEEGKGVKVQDVDDDSPASKAGFKEGDVITSVNGKEIEGVDELRSQIKDVKEGDVIKFNYRRNGSAQSVDVKIPKKLKTADL